MQEDDCDILHIADKNGRECNEFDLEQKMKKSRCILKNQILHITQINTQCMKLLMRI